MNKIKEFFVKTAAFFKTAAKNTAAFFKAAAKAVVAFFKVAPGKIAAFFKVAPGKVAAFFKAAPGKIAKFFKELPSNLVKLRKNFIPWVKSIKWKIVWDHVTTGILILLMCSPFLILGYLVIWFLSK